jgi:hypothetical protein
MWMNLLVFVIALSVLANLWFVGKWIHRFLTCNLAIVGQLEGGGWAIVLLPSCKYTYFPDMRDMIVAMREIAKTRTIGITEDNVARFNQYPGILTPEDVEIIDKAKRIKRPG